MPQITWGQSTHIGLIRHDNEDSILSLHFAGSATESRGNIGLFIVADGMGGKGVGSQASRLAVQTIAENLLGVLLRQTPLVLDQDVIAKEITEAVQAANLKIWQLSIMERGAASTVSLALITDDSVTIGHVGETVVFQIENGQIRQLTRIHDFIQVLIDRGHFSSREEALKYPSHRVLLRALGMDETLEVDTLSFPMLPGSHLLLCSDGLSNLVKPDELLHFATSSITPQQVCDDLIALANSRGGYDNVSVIVIRA